MASPTHVCQIPGNSDIAGIGVRASVYIQACLAGLNLPYLLHTLVFTEEETIRAPAGKEGTKASPTAQATAGTRPEDGLAISIRPSLSTDSLDSTEKALRNFRNENAEYLGVAKALERSLFMVGFAVILSAIVEAKSRTGLSAYHALIVLNISQINNWAGFLLLLLRGEFRTTGIGWIGRIFVTRRSLMSSLLCVAHAIMMSALGLYFWSNLGPFLGYAGDIQSCHPLTYFRVFGPVNISNKALRISSLAFYAVSLVPVFGLYFLALIPGFALIVFTLVTLILLLVLVPVLVVLGAIYFLILKPVIVFMFRPVLRTSAVQNVITSLEGPWSIIREQSRRAFLSLRFRTTGLLNGPSYSPLFTFTMAVFFSAPLVYAIISTELIIRVNRDNVEPGAESKWTYGQTLALFTALVAVILYINELLAIQRRRKRARNPVDHELGRRVFFERGTQT
ncbi:hypothetical protein LshimejAT787_1601970 [Lyophyllum shimeji]|uniref:Transmembrane protein n=1 Tax=Lyophyllum shimeji TaxID=47721 RepID=A0A9P3PZU0_LYOSH|nr:hypothetical protein LshimejAT787_1601970 [Lyophyllum shimeji]